MNIKSPAITGDIILISQSRKNANLILQSILRLGRARHSHVAVALYQANLIHAMPKDGVRMQSLSEYLQINRNFVVYRNKSAILEDKAYLLEKYLRHHNLQDYSLLNLLFTSWRHSFCSELAAKAYSNAGLKLTKNNRKPKRVLPIDIYRHVSIDPEWIDMTHDYKEFFFNKDHAVLMEKVAALEQRTVEFTQDMGYGQQKLINRINFIAARQGNKEMAIEPPMSFWSNRLANRPGFWFVWLYWRQMANKIVKHFLACLIRRRK